MIQQAAIVAQIAITALSLDGLSQVHWVSRAAFTLSLVASLSCVYYACNQYQNLGRLTSPEDLDRWVKTHGTTLAESLLGESLRALIAKRSRFLPSAALVITLAAPGNLLSTSVFSFLIGYGVYLGQVWTQGLDSSASLSESHAVFITYVAVLSVCIFIYVLSLNVQGERDSNYRYVSTLSEWADMDEQEEQALEQEEQALARDALGLERTRQVETVHSNEVADMGISEAFQEAARLHQQMAAVDQRLAELLEESSRRGPGSGTQEAPNNPTSEG